MTKSKSKGKITVGSSVKVRNAYGVNLGVKTVTEIKEHEGRLIYYVTPTQTPWMHHEESSLTLVQSEQPK